MFKYKEKEDTDTTSDSDEEQIQFKLHQPRFLCHVTTSSDCDDLLVIQTPTNQDIHLKALCVRVSAVMQVCNKGKRAKTKIGIITGLYKLKQPTISLSWDVLSSILITAP